MVGSKVSVVCKRYVATTLHLRHPIYFFEHSKGVLVAP
jgi:hypothetical protein